MNTDKSQTDAITYKPPVIDGDKVRIDLSRNEALPAIAPDLLAQYTLDASRVSRYPDSANLAKAIATRHGVDASQVVVTAGGDEAIDRVIRACLVNRQLDRRRVLTHQPTFEMIEVYAAASSGVMCGPVWTEGEFPLKEILQQLSDEVALLALVTPNNPTGRSIPFAELQQAVLQAEQGGIPVMVDLAYIEFADSDPTSWLLERKQVVMIRTFSKAFGMAGCRLGYALTSNAELAHKIRGIAGPFPTSRISLELGIAALQRLDAMQDSVNAIKDCRRWLVEGLTSRGVHVLPSDANFVLAKFEAAGTVFEKLLRHGIAVRIFPGRDLLQGYLRITVPRSANEQTLLAHALGISSGDSETQLGSRPTSSWQADGQEDSDHRTGQLTRQTRETTIRCFVNLDRSRPPKISTGIGFFDHMLTALGTHSGIELQVECQGDLQVDDHHSIEDCGLVIGSTISDALGDRKGVRRYGWALLAMDEALAQVAIDLSGRPSSVINLNLVNERIGDVASENLTHFFQSLAVTLRCALHIDVVCGDNDHHKAEAAFKGLAKALAMAVSRTGDESIPSTKGSL
ncbi:MAG TPA: imidazoleglycerol-phosphate dehydratase HisB [Pirellulaceae bacterium]|nr:imidazoleglycerol-phosphate dehydratase HisB [Pirellulaceae bacterium]HMP70757.1 imidazoleglycerol-phosphate dehydratase HisB [Pirellulaceae bacterium]